jgi:hypothetical protein
MATKETVYQLNDQTIVLSGLADYETGVAITGATLTATLYDSTDTPVPGFIGIVLTDVAGTPGNYHGYTNSESVPNPPIGSGYWLVVSGIAETKNIYFERACTVAVRSI